MKKIYRPKKINQASIVGGLIFLLLLAITCYFTNELVIFATAAIAGIVTPVLISFLTSYIIDNDILIIKIWFGKTKIDISTIKKIKETNLKYNIDICYKKYKQITITPKYKYEFINDLKNINPEIEVEYYVKK